MRAEDGAEGERGAAGRVHGARAGRHVPEGPRRPLPDAQPGDGPRLRPAGRGDAGPPARRRCSRRRRWRRSAATTPRCWSGASRPGCEECLEGRDAYAWSMVIRFPVRDAAGRIVQIGGFDLDITAQKRALAELAASEERLRGPSPRDPVPMSIARLARPPPRSSSTSAYPGRFGLRPRRARRLRPRRLYADPEERGALLRRSSPRAGARSTDHEIDAAPARRQRRSRRVTDRALLDVRGRARRRYQPRLDLTALTAAEAEVVRHARGAAPEREADRARLAPRRGRARAQQPALGRDRLRRDAARHGRRPGDPRPGPSEVHGAAERCARIVKTFLAMARQKPPRRGPVGLPRGGRGALELAAYGLRTRRRDGRGRRRRPACRRSGRRRPAPPGAGQPRRQRAAGAGPGARAAPARGPGRGPRTATVVVEVEDNGPGMPPDVRKRAFEPFFTTKPQGVGHRHRPLGLPRHRRRARRPHRGRDRAGPRHAVPRHAAGWRAGRCRGARGDGAGPVAAAARPGAGRRRRARDRRAGGRDAGAGRLEVETATGGRRGAGPPRPRRDRPRGERPQDARHGRAGAGRGVAGGAAARGLAG